MHSDTSKIREKIFSSAPFDFEEAALDVFLFQYRNNLVYQQFTNFLKINPKQVTSVHQIPFLPVEFFKSHPVMIHNVIPEKIFESSGTTGQINSKHYVSDIKLYEESFQKGFNQFYGKTDDWIILALLPSYLERDTSSLVYMVHNLIQGTSNEHSGFYLNNLSELVEKISYLISQKSGSKVLLIGVTFALLDFAEQYPMDLSNLVIMETGGMKGRREELSRDEVHAMLKAAFQTTAIHSEYGMTELLSQAYSNGDGTFETPAWMKILKRDVYNPLQVSSVPGRGGLNVIDLANLNSCSFIATQDAVELLENGRFKITGRLDNADLRGCNLMVSDI